MLKFHREIKRRAQVLGVRDVAIEHGGRHPSLVGRFDGHRVRLVIATSPSDNRAFANSVAQLRRLLRAVVG